MARRIALLNNKGGVGKTFSAVALAESAARQGGRVLVVDMDPQANATRRLGVHNPEPTRTLTNCLRPGLSAGEARRFITANGWPAGLDLRIDLLAADLDLEDRSLEAGVPGAHTRLRRALENVDSDYDLTIIDCPPSIKGHLTTMAISALDDIEDAVLLPLTPEYDAVGGARRALSFVQLWKQELGVPQVQIAGMIVNAIRANTDLHKTGLTNLVSVMGEDVPILAKIPQRTRIAELQNDGRPIGAEFSLTDVREQFDQLAATLVPREEQQW